MTPVPRLSHLLPDRLNHLVLELDDLHVGHHGPVLPVEDIQRLRDVPQSRDRLQPLVLKVRELSPGGHHTVHRDLRASEHWHLHTKDCSLLYCQRLEDSVLDQVYLVLVL